jgi:hypothetical protein
MGDQLNNEYDDEYARTHILGRHYLILDDHFMHWILNHIGFDRQARLNVKAVHLIDMKAVLETIRSGTNRQAIGNLQALGKGHIWAKWDTHPEMSGRILESSATEDVI